MPTASLLLLVFVIFCILLSASTPLQCGAASGQDLICLLLKMALDTAFFALMLKVGATLWSLLAGWSKTCRKVFFAARAICSTAMPHWCFACLGQSSSYTTDMPNFAPRCCCHVACLLCALRAYEPYESRKAAPSCWSFPSFSCCWSFYAFYL